MYGLVKSTGTKLYFLQEIILDDKTELITFQWTTNIDNATTTTTKIGMIKSLCNFLEITQDECNAKYGKLIFGLDMLKKHKKQTTKT